MIITLNDGRQVEIKNINIAGGSVDYRRINDPIYSGDCVLYVSIADFSTAEEEIKAALEVELAS
jgi:hypothetical protein